MYVSLYNCMLLVTINVRLYEINMFKQPFFYKIHSGTVSLDKDKYLTPAPNLRRTRASHESESESE